MNYTLRKFLAVTFTLSLGAAAGAAEQSGREIDMLKPPLDIDGPAIWQAFHEDPRAKASDIWDLRDGVMTCKGTPKGYLYTRENFTNFVLKLEWRWPPGAEPGKGGVLLRMTGKNRIWPKSLEAQINAGDAGDFWGLDGYQLTGPEQRTKTLRHEQFGKLTNVKKTKALENPPGQWNKYEIIADGEVVTLVINGQVVNKATGCEVTPGKICLTAEGNPIQFRNVRLTPRTK